MHESGAYLFPASPLGISWLAGQAERKPAALIHTLEVAQSGNWAVEGVEYESDMARLSPIGAIFERYLEFRLRHIILEYARRRRDGWDGAFDSERPENRLLKYIADEHSVILDFPKARDIAEAVARVFIVSCSPTEVVEYAVKFINRNLTGVASGAGQGLVAKVHSRDGVVVDFVPLPEPRD